MTKTIHDLLRQQAEHIGHENLHYLAHRIALIVDNVVYIHFLCFTSNISVFQ